MVDVTTLVAFAERLAGWLKTLVEANAATRARWKGAVVLLQTAVLQTQRYVAQLDRGGTVDRDAEMALALAWQSAADAFYGLDGALAERLQLKAEFWTYPEQWTDRDVVQANIALEQVAQYTRQLLREGR